MHLIIRYHQSVEEQNPDSPLPDSEWLPTWRVDGPDEPLEGGRGSTLTLTGETRLPIISAGMPLETGTIYLDLRNPGHGPFRSLEGQVAGEGNAYVAQGDLPIDFWNQLVRICARAGELALGGSRSGGQYDVVLVLEPVEPLVDTNISA